MIIATPDVREIGLRGMTVMGRSAFSQSMVDPDTVRERILVDAFRGPRFPGARGLAGGEVVLRAEGFFHHGLIAEIPFRVNHLAITSVSDIGESNLRGIQVFAEMSLPLPTYEIKAFLVRSVPRLTQLLRNHLLHHVETLGAQYWEFFVAPFPAKWAGPCSQKFFDDVADDHSITTLNFDAVVRVATSFLPPGMVPTDP